MNVVYHFVNDLFAVNRVVNRAVIGSVIGVVIGVVIRAVFHCEIGSNVAIRCPNDSNAVMVYGFVICVSQLAMEFDCLIHCESGWHCVIDLSAMLVYSNETLS